MVNYTTLQNHLKNIQSPALLKILPSAKIILIFPKKQNVWLASLQIPNVEWRIFSP